MAVSGGEVSRRSSGSCSGSRSESESGITIGSFDLPFPLPLPLVADDFDGVLTLDFVVDLDVFLFLRLEVGGVVELVFDGPASAGREVGVGGCCPIISFSIVPAFPFPVRISSPA